MTIGGQYGEDEIVLDFFKDTAAGIVVDFGAADGITNSNSYCLLKDPRWLGFLVEPEPSQYALLEERYKDRKNVQTVNCAVGPEAGRMPFFCGGQVSTLDTTWRDRCIEIHQIDYQEIEVDVWTPSDILSSLGGYFRIDFLTIDCEGWDLPILRAVDLEKYRPRLICLEGRTIPDTLELAGYYVYQETHGNIFFAEGK